MNISKVDANRRAGGTRSSASSGAKNGAFAATLHSAASSNTASEVQVSGAFAVGSVLSIQEAPDATAEASRRALNRYADDVLDRLEEIRLNILAGAVSKERLTDLARTLRARQGQIDDPRLSAIIGEIELRAEVEIAKLTRKP
jgi:cob(I)alamin adenosyltransferase